MKNVVSGVKCLVCGETIYSKHRHDFRWCKCHTVAVGGGRSYLRITGNENNYEVVKIDINVLGDTA